MADRVTLRSGELAAVIDPLGAELVSLTDAAGEWMTDADPAFWTGHAPILFPIVGALAGGSYRLDGAEYSLPQHGFARRRTFTLLEQDAASVRFRLRDDAETREAYPFAFALDVVHRLSGRTLATEVTVTNTDTRDLPASVGFHPAFAWPLPGGGVREDHRIVFAADEPDALASIVPGGLIGPDPRPTPLEDGRTLALADALFTADALVWERVRSRSVRYRSPDGPALTVAYPEMPSLGIWTKPGAAFLCIEPWQGHADPAGFAGEIWDKPGMCRIAPGATRTFAMAVTLEG